MAEKTVTAGYYSVLDDLLAELQGVMIEEYLERIKNYRIPEDLDKINREFFLYSAEKGADRRTF